MIDLIAGRYTVRAGFGAAFDADNLGGNMLGLGISLTRANLGVSVRSFDFTTGTLPAGVTFTRAGAATYFDAAGVLQTAAADQPRFDHDPMTLQQRGLLIEESRTNLLLQSNALNVSPWVANMVTPTTDAYTMNGVAVPVWRLVETTGTSHHGISQQTTGVTVGTRYSMQGKLAAAERGFGFFGFNGGGVIAFATINLATGVVSVATDQGGGAPVFWAEPLPDGAWQVYGTVTATATTNMSADYRLSYDGVWANRSYAGDGTSGIYVWGAQLETGAFPTSYIPTTTAAITRAADSCVMTGAAFSDWFNPLEGTIVADFSTITNGLSNTGGSGFFWVYDIDSSGAATSSHELLVSAAYGPGINARTQVAGTSQAAFTSPVTLGTGSTILCAYTYKTNDFAGSLNGGSVLVDAAGSLPPAPDRMAIGSSNGGSSSHLNGHLRRIRYWPRRLTNSQLQELSA